MPQPFVAKRLCRAQSFGSSVDVATPGRSLELALWFAKLLGQ
jgi:hypothetical protein